MRAAIPWRLSFDQVQSELLAETKYEKPNVISDISLAGGHQDCYNLKVQLEIPSLLIFNSTQ